MKTAKSLIVIALFVLSLACGGTTETNISANKSTATAAPTSSATPIDELAMGRKLFSQNCANCHKEDGTGGKVTIEGKTIKPDNLTSDKIKKFDDDKITGYIFNGVEDEGMPAFGEKLSEAQIREIVNYVRVGLQKMPPPSPTQTAR